MKIRPWVPLFFNVLAIVFIGAVVYRDRPDEMHALGLVGWIAATMGLWEITALRSRVDELERTRARE